MRLRLPTLEDAAGVAAYASDPYVTRYVSWPTHRSLADAESFLRYAIGAIETGHFATEAAEAIVVWALAQPTVHRVWAMCDVDNVASVRVLEKIGMRRLANWAVLPNLGGVPRDCWCYARAK